MKKILLLGFLFAASLVMATPNCKSPIVQGSLAYREGNFEKAIELWQTCVEQGFQSADLYYNLGNAYFRDGRVGFAVLYYESALRLNPANEDYLHNLKFVQGLTKDKVEENAVEENPILSAFFKAHHALSLETQLHIILAIVWIFAFDSPSTQCQPAHQKRAYRKCISFSVNLRDYWIQCRLQNLCDGNLSQGRCDS